MKKDCIDARKIYKEMYPDYFNGSGICKPIPTFALNEVGIRPIFSRYSPDQVDLTSSIGPIALPVPLLSAAMDTVSGPHMAKVLSTLGGCAVIYRHKRPEVQIEWIKDALSYHHCLVDNPKSLMPDNPLEYAKDILKEFGFSTIPVIERDGTLKGVLFTDDIVFKGKLGELVKDFMKPLGELKTADINTSFYNTRDRLYNEEHCSVLPVVDKEGRLKGIYFKQDFYYANPSFHNSRPLVGMAVGVQEEDLERVKEAIKLGIGIIVIDSSHGNCPPVIKQATRIVQMVGDKAAVIAGNIADVDGYCRLAETGVDAVKFGIGSGSICTTSQVTGAGVGMFTLARELNFTRKKVSRKINAPALIADGGINGPKDMVIILATGSHGCMAGKWLVAASESLSCQEKLPAPFGKVFYRGMASKTAIESRLSDRYGKQKRAAEGVEGYVVHKGPLMKWFKYDLELIKGGFAHAGAGNIKELHNFGELPYAFTHFSSSGQMQIAARVEQE